MSLYSVLATLSVSYTHYSHTSFIRRTWCLSTLYWPYCMCLTSTTLRPRLSEQLGVSLLCTGHTVCVLHPLQSDLVYPNNLVSLYPVLTILYVSHIHYSQTSFIRTTWCLSTLYWPYCMCLTSTTLRPRLAEQLGVFSTLYWPYCMCLTSTTVRPRLSEQLGVSLLCTGHTVCVSHRLQSDLIYPNNSVSFYSVLAILYVSHIHYSQTSFIQTTWCLSTLYWPYCMCLTSTTLRPRLSEQLGVSLLCTGHTVCVSHPLQSDLVYPNNLVSLYSVLAILYVSHIHYSQTSFIRTTWCLSTLLLAILYVVSHPLGISDLVYPWISNLSTSNLILNLVHGRVL